MSRSCGKCGGKGHNRRTCTYYGSKPSVAEKPVEVSAVSQNTRRARCSYCLKKEYTVDRSHSVRTCPKRKAKLAEFIQNNARWARDYKTSMCQNGFGIGTIVDQYGNPSIITRIDWENLSYTDAYGAYRTVRLTEIGDTGWGYTRSVLPPKYGSYDSETTILSRISAESVAKQFPPDWEKGMYGIPEYLRDSGGGRKKKS